MNQVTISVRHQLSVINLDWNHLKSMLVRKCFKTCRIRAFFDEMSGSTQNYLSAEKSKELRNLADDRSTVIKSPDKGSSIAICDGDDSL